MILGDSLRVMARWPGEEARQGAVCLHRSNEESFFVRHAEIAGPVKARSTSV
jgi:hypothetical protein